VNLKLILNIFYVEDVYLKSFKVALVVGSFLNMINQGGQIVNLEFEQINYFKLVLTYIVPFLVSSYTAITIQMKFDIGSKAIISSKIHCLTCDENAIVVRRNEIIPLCKNCGINTNWEAI